MKFHFVFFTALFLISTCRCSLMHALKGEHYQRSEVDETFKLNENFYQPEQIHISYGCNLNSTHIENYSVLSFNFNL